MRVKELRHLAEINASKQVRIYNPDLEDFTVNYHGYPVTIRSMEMQTYAFEVANHIKKHLADKLLHKRGTKTSPQDDIQAIYKEIEVQID
jgi:hypothetical protein